MTKSETRQRGILLVNLGSPDSPSVPDVRKYLRQFLMDERVIDAPYLIRKMIVELFILPFRPKNSAHAYQSIWWDEGSPLVVLSQRVHQSLQEKIRQPVALGMRYGNPSIEHGIRELLNAGVTDFLLVPLYPHYAMSTYETVVVEAQRILQKLKTPVKMETLPPFYNDPLYIDALAASSADYLKEDYDHLLFSYHGLPERHLKKTDPTGQHCLQVENCCHIASPAHARCYRHQVFQTTEALAKKLGIPAGKYSVAFQSRLGTDKWLDPYTEKELIRLAESGIKKLLVICPAFVSDCLETLEEIGMRGKETFLEAGGKEYLQIPCMNENPRWIETLRKWLTGETVVQTSANVRAAG